MRYHLSTLKREVQRLKGKIDDGSIIVLNLSNGETYQVKEKNLCTFGATALFDADSSECRVVTDAVEPKNKMIQLLKMVLDENDTPAIGAD